MEEKKKGIGVWILLLFFMLVIGGIGGFFVGYKVIKPKDKVDEKEKVEEKHKLELTEEVKERMQHFTKISYQIQSSIGSPFETYNNLLQINSDLMKEFYGGNLSKKTKLVMAYESCRLNHRFVSNVTIPHYKLDYLLGEKPGTNETVTVLKKDDFAEEYAKLFQEKVEYTLEEIKDIGCPLPWAMDKENTEGYLDAENIYLFSRCGGTTGGEVTCTNDQNYESDEKYYYLHYKEKCSHQNGRNEEHKSVWKFDKDLKFINATEE